MAKTNNGLSDVIRQMSSQVDGLSLQDLLKPISTSSGSQSGSSSAGSIPSLGDSKSLSLGSKDAPTGIQFGRPSSTRISSLPSSNMAASLISQTASGGIAGVLGGFGSILGLGGLVSGLTSLFGGGAKTLSPLVEFTLPDSQQQTVYVSSKGSTTMQGTDVDSTTSSSSSMPAQPGAATAGQTAQMQSSQIVQTVKNALLNSSSLNDVIAEI